MNHRVKVEGVMITAQFAVEVIYGNMMGYNPRRLVTLETLDASGLLRNQEDQLELLKQRGLKYYAEQASEQSRRMGRATIEQFIKNHIKMLDFKNFDIT